MCIPVHSPWLPGYNDVTQTVLIRLTIAGFFQDSKSLVYFVLYKGLYIQTVITNSFGIHCKNSNHGELI